MRSGKILPQWTTSNPEYARELFEEDHMNRMRQNNPDMDTMMMENMMNRMEQDTAYGREFMRRMEDRRLFHDDVMR